MKKLIVSMVACALGAMLNINPAKAQPTLTAESCLRKDECLVTVNHNVDIFRKGELIESIPDLSCTTVCMGGWITAMNGYIVTTWNGDTRMYSYNVETKTRCEIDLGLNCNESIAYYNPAAQADRVRAVCENSREVVWDPNTCVASQSGMAATTPYSMSLGRERIFVGDYFDGVIQVLPYFNPNFNSIPTSQTRAVNVRYWTDPGPGSGVADDFIYFTDLSKIFKVPALDSSFNETVFYDFSPMVVNLQHMVINRTHVLAAHQNHKAFLIDMANPSTHIDLGVQSARGIALSPRTAYVLDSEPTGALKTFDLQGNPRAWNFGPAVAMAYMAPIYPPVCGDGLQQDDPLTPDVEEVCDGTDFDGDTCQKHGFDSGELACNQNCELDFGGCFYTCGNNIAAPTEECDSLDVKDQTCENLGFVNGTLLCTTSCELDLSDCESCGNNRIDFEEVCDGTDFGTTTCRSEGFDGGSLTCNNSCSQIDTSSCTICGDGTIEGQEMCEGADLNGLTCESLGFGKGTLLCSSSCIPDVSLCPPPTETLKKKGCNTCGTGDSGQGIIFVLTLMVALLIRSSRKRRK